jgi:hypothetical protein
LLIGFGLQLSTLFFSRGASFLAGPHSRLRFDKSLGLGVSLFAGGINFGATSCNFALGTTQVFHLGAQLFLCLVVSSFPISTEALNLFSLSCFSRSLFFLQPLNFIRQPFPGGLQICLLLPGIIRRLL